MGCAGTLDSIFFERCGRAIRGSLRDAVCAVVNESPAVVAAQNGGFVWGPLSNVGRSAVYVFHGLRVDQISCSIRGFVMALPVLRLASGTGGIAEVV